MAGRPLDTLLVTFGVSLILQQLAKDLFSANNKEVTTPTFLQGKTELLGVSMTHTRLFLFAVVLVSMGLVALFLSKLAAGRRMRAVMQNRDLAAVSGLPVSRVDATTFFLGSGLAGVAGVAVSLIGSVGPGTGTAYILSAFLVVIVGGVGSLKGAVLAALALGILNSYVEFSTSSTLARAAVFAFVILFLQWRPNGIVSFRTRGSPHERPGSRSINSHGLPEERGQARDRHQPRPPASEQVFGQSDPAVKAPRRTPLSMLFPKSSNPWTARMAFVAFAVVLLAVPSFLGNPTDVRQWAEWLCYAMVAVGLDIAWGYGGMLCLGQGLFFGLGAYAMGMHLSLENVPKGSLPSFMSLYSDYTELPLLWRPFQSFWFTAFAAVIVPMIVAGLLGLLVFKRRIRGPFFAILTQATAVIFALVLISNLKLTSGFNGLTGFTKIFGRNKYQPSTNTWLYMVSAIGLLVVLAIAMKVVRSRYGKLLQATRDSEDRVRFLGYDPAIVKAVGFMIAAGMAGLAGAIAAPVFGIVSPGQFDYVPSILMICWVAVGGRGTLWGAVLGALVVNWARVKVSAERPDDWLYLQGLLFVVVLAFAPGGIAGVVKQRFQGLMAVIERRRHKTPGDVELIEAGGTV